MNTNSPLTFENHALDRAEATTPASREASSSVQQRRVLEHEQTAATWAPAAPRTTTGSDAQITDSSGRKIETAKRPFRILIADDHEALRRGLRSALLGAGWQVCGEAADGRQAIEKTTELKPDLVLLDLSMPVMSGHEAAREILRNNPGVKIVVFTMHESQQVRDALNKIGVHALAVKSAPLSLLLDTIQTVLGS